MKLLEYFLKDPEPDPCSRVIYQGLHRLIRAFAVRTDTGIRALPIFAAGFPAWQGRCRKIHPSLPDTPGEFFP